MVIIIKKQVHFLVKNQNLLDETLQIALPCLSHSLLALLNCPQMYELLYFS